MASHTKEAILVYRSSRLSPKLCPHIDGMDTVAHDFLHSDRRDMQDFYSLHLSLEHIITLQW